MKKVLIHIIAFYQVALSPLLSLIVGAPAACRFTPSCSEYMKQSVQKHGVIRGVNDGLSRLVRCQPFSHKYANI